MLLLDMHPHLKIPLDVQETVFPDKTLIVLDFLWFPLSPIHSKRWQQWQMPTQTKQVVYSFLVGSWLWWFWGQILYIAYIKKLAKTIQIASSKIWFCNPRLQEKKLPFLANFRQLRDIQNGFEQMTCDAWQPPKFERTRPCVTRDVRIERNGTVAAWAACKYSLHIVL